MGRNAALLIPQEYWCETCRGWGHVQAKPDTIKRRECSECEGTGCSKEGLKHLVGQA